LTYSLKKIITLFPNTVSLRLQTKNLFVAKLT